MGSGRRKAPRLGLTFGGAHGLALLQMEGKLGEHHSGQLRQETAELRAERVIGEELGRLGWTEAELRQRRKGDPEKMAVAARLRQETTLMVKAIAARLHLGTARSANARLRERLRGRERNKAGQSQLEI